MSAGKRKPKKTDLHYSYALHGAVVSSEAVKHTHLNSLAREAEEAVSMGRTGCSNCIVKDRVTTHCSGWRDMLSSKVLQAAERLNHQGAAGVLPPSAANETDE